MIASLQGYRAVILTGFTSQSSLKQSGGQRGRRRSNTILLTATLLLIVFQTTGASSVVGEAPHLVNVDGKPQDVIYLGPAPPLTVGEILTVTALAVDNDTYADNLEARLVWQRNNSDVVHNKTMFYSNPPEGVTGKWYYDLEVNAPALYQIQVIISDGGTWIYSDIRTVEWLPAEDHPAQDEGAGLKESVSYGGAVFLMFLSFMGVGCVMIYSMVARRTR